jgi:hypothetical protein
VPHRALDGLATSKDRQAIGPSSPVQPGRRTRRHRASASRASTRGGRAAFLTALDAKVAKAACSRSRRWSRSSCRPGTAQPSCPRRSGASSTRTPDVGLLVVDDNSEDDTAAIVAGFSDPASAMSQGPGRARLRPNIGLAETRGRSSALHSTATTSGRRATCGRWSRSCCSTVSTSPTQRCASIREEVRFRGRGFKYRDLVEMNYIDSTRSSTGGRSPRARRLRRAPPDDGLGPGSGTRGRQGRLRAVHRRHLTSGRTATGSPCREPISWRFRVQNRYLIDWTALEAGLGGPRPRPRPIVIGHSKFDLTNGCLGRSTGTLARRVSRSSSSTTRRPGNACQHGAGGRRPATT